MLGLNWFEKDMSGSTAVAQAMRETDTGLHDYRDAALQQSLRHRCHVPIDQVNVEDGSSDRAILYKSHGLLHAGCWSNNLTACVFNGQCKIEGDEWLILADQNTGPRQHKEIPIRTE